jgi:TolA-binding protein
MVMSCHGSDEAGKTDNVPPPPTIQGSPKSLTAVLLKDCKEENDSLTRTVEKLQQDFRGATARVAELETQVADLRDRAGKVAAEEEKPTAVITPPTKSVPKVNSSSAPTSGSAYEDGLALYRKRNFKEGLAKFLEASGDGTGEFGDRGTYWAGECHYAMKDYTAAIESFGRVLGYHTSPKKDAAQMMLGNCYLALGEKSKAKEEFQKLITNFPASEYVKRAKGKLSGL